MATDLKQVQDHPARILWDIAERNGARLKAPASEAAFKAAAERLHAHEQENGVTFAALDNDALARVAESYDLLTGGGSVNRDLVQQDLNDAIRDLLGLGD